MSYDLLLEFMTALRSGPWEKFKVAAEEVAAADAKHDEYWSVTGIAEKLSAMGYVEFAFDDTLAWSVPPPVLVTATAATPTTALLTGGRTHKLLESIGREGPLLGATVTSSPTRDAPTTVSVESRNEAAIIQLAGRVGIAMETAVVDKLARCLPSLSSSIEAAPVAEPPSGWPIERFDHSSLEWVAIDRVDGDLLFRFRTFRPEYRYLHDGRNLKVSRAIGVYAALQRRQQPVIHYNARTQEMTVALQAHLPVLYARALSLCIGGLPVEQRDELVMAYSPVPQHVAVAVMSGLEQAKES